MPTHEATDCTFAPQINGDARARRPRTVDELSAGDAQRRSQAHAVLAACGERSDRALPSGDQRGPGVQSRLGFSEPESYCTGPSAYGTEGESDRVRARRRGLELQECTFHPQTHEAPACRESPIDAARESSAPRAGASARMEVVGRFIIATIAGRKGATRDSLASPRARPFSSCSKSLYRPDRANAAPSRRRRGWAFPAGGPAASIGSR